MNSSILLLALTAGMVGAINPCGFSLLPAYIGSFVAGDDVESPLDRRLLRAVWSAVSVTAGFVLVFVILGVVLSSLADRIRGQLPWVTMLIGGVLIVAGVAVMAGRQLPMPAFTLRAASGRGGGHGELRRRLRPGLAVLHHRAIPGHYLGRARPVLGRRPARLRRVRAWDGDHHPGHRRLGSLGPTKTGTSPSSPVKTRPTPGGALMIISGSYAIWYARWELAVYSGDLSTDVIIDTGERWRLKAITFIENVGAVRLGVMLLIAVAATIGISQIVSERRSPRGTTDAK